MPKNRAKRTPPAVAYVSLGVLPPVRENAREFARRLTEHAGRTVYQDEAVALAMRMALAAVPAEPSPESREAVRNLLGTGPEPAGDPHAPVA